MAARQSRKESSSENSAGDLRDKDEGSSGWWLGFYEKRERTLPDLTTLTWMASYNRFLFERLSGEVRARSRSAKQVRVWDAGAGVDLVPYKLKETFGETISLTISDISEICIQANKRSFDKAGLKADFVVGDLFNASFVEEFDIVMNTGLLEHFSRGQQEELLRVISRSLRPGGVFMTLVPSAGGKLYVHCMRRMTEKGKWEHEDEHPVTTFKGLEMGDLELVEEVSVGAVDQFASFRVAYPLMSSLAAPAIALFEVLPAAEPLLERVIGGYCLFARFVKKADSGKARSE